MRSKVTDTSSPLSFPKAIELLIFNICRTFAEFHPNRKENEVEEGSSGATREHEIQNEQYAPVDKISFVPQIVDHRGVTSKEVSFLRSLSPTPLNIK